MTISKEEAVQELMSAADNCITESDLREHFEHIIFGLTVDHPKVKLPREVGEELDATVKYLKAGRTDTDAFDYMAGILYDGDERENHQNLSDWYNRTANAALILADALRYGWTTETETKWYVKAPESWSKEKIFMFKNDAGEVLPCNPNHAAFDSDVTQFTRAELKQYHLDSDIFTLVLVGVEK